MGMDIIQHLLFAGFVSNGEFNYLRSKGYTRPLSVLQIRTDVRNMYSKTKMTTLLKMLMPKGEPCVCVCVCVCVTPQNN